MRVSGISFQTDKMSLFFKYEAFILLAVMTFTACKIENIPHIDVTCDISGIYLLFTFEKPFKGLVYALNYHNDDQCRSAVKSSSGDSQRLLYLPIDRCGNVVTGNGTRSISNTVVVQQHNVLQTMYDFTQDIMCDVFYPSKRVFVPKISENNSEELKFHKLEIWADFKLDLDGISTNKVSLGTRILLVIHVKDGGIHSGMSVKNCIAHDQEQIHKDSKIASLTNENGCPYPLSIISRFNFTRETRNVSDIMAYAEIKAFKFPTQGNLFVTCLVQLCKYSCSNTCSESNLSALRNLEKRSIEENIPLIRSLENRNSLMKATIKALSSALMKSKRGKVLSRNNHLEKTFFDRSLVNNYYDIETEKSEEIFTTLSEQMDSVENISTQTTKAAVNADLFNISSIKIEIPSDVGNSIPLLKEQNSIDTQTNLILEENLNEVVYFNVTKSFSVVSPVEPPKDISDSIFMEDFDSDCVPKIRFSLVTGMLSAIIFCLLLTCLALILHARREKRRHLIDNFLLYNFY